LLLLLVNVPFQALTPTLWEKHAVVKYLLFECILFLFMTAISQGS